MGAIDAIVVWVVHKVLSFWFRVFICFQIAFPAIPHFYSLWGWFSEVKPHGITPIQQKHLRTHFKLSKCFITSWRRVFLQSDILMFIINNVSYKQIILTKGNCPCCPAIKWGWEKEARTLERIEINNSNSANYLFFIFFSPLLSLFLLDCLLHFLCIFQSHCWDFFTETNKTQKIALFVWPLCWELFRGLRKSVHCNHQGQ